MTPLAHTLTKAAIWPKKERNHVFDTLGLGKALSGTHCFEVTGAWPLVMQLVSSQGESIFDKTDQLVFLPSPNCWIEFMFRNRPYRQGYYLSAPDGSDYIQVSCALWAKGIIITYPLGNMDRADIENRKDNLMVYPFPEWRKYIPNEHVNWDYDPNPNDEFGFLWVILALINSPKIIGRSQHMPNSALERKLTSKLGRGKFPLHAWTEIKLDVSKPADIDDGEPHEAHLTGARALHFCRKHIRIKMGKLEYVRAHWRGDPAIGIKQSRYIVSGASHV